MKIVLIGYMASGKSVVGRLLSTELNTSFIDLDDYIESKERKNISAIFKEKGEIYFRLKETKYLAELLKGDTDFVLSLGGGTPCYGNNMGVILERASSSHYLKASLNTIYNRLIAEKSKRPLVATIDNENLKEFIAKHLFERSPFYSQSTTIINTDGLSIEEVVGEIKKSLI